MKQTLSQWGVDPPVTWKTLPFLIDQIFRISKFLTHTRDTHWENYTIKTKRMAKFKYQYSEIGGKGKGESQSRNMQCHTSLLPPTPFRLHVSSMLLNPFICCFQVDGYKYFMQCKEEAAVCAREIRHKCVCNTFTQYSRACASQDVVLKWRTDKFCREWFGLLDTFSGLFSLYINISFKLDFKVAQHPF